MMRRISCGWKKYAIVIFYSEEDGGYIADVPDLKYCSAFGETPEKVMQEILIARKAWLESLLTDNQPLPQPKFSLARYLEAEKTQTISA